MQKTKKSPGVILLAAGKSTRFRQATGRHKLLENMPGTALCVFEHSLQHIRAAGLPLMVILRHEDIQLQEICQGMSVPFTCVNSQGMGESIATGVKATQDWAGWIITLADMPFIKSELFENIALHVAEGNAVRPVYLGQVGHPVGFPLQTKLMLEALTQEQGARDVLKSYPPLLLPVDDVGCIWDIDLPEQLSQTPDTDPSAS
ncbi:nucleotidyltransferase family protein [Rouxiella sp. Mn2063]|uniref:nucleotidyltransferase family protein n=1 Tax=Rouxiella sp. Mn2063 TaxID=3395262 RepID=UPI003BE87F56